MSLLQKAVETYDSQSHLVGVAQEGHATLALIAHIITEANICVTVNENGKFVDAVEMKEKIIIPVTEKSAGRTAAPIAHPLCEQIGYLIPQNEDKYSLYLCQLRDWSQSSFSHPKLLPILQYAESGTILDDLAARSLIELNDKGMPTKDKTMICWRVIGTDPNAPANCWMDQSLADSFIQFYLSKKESQQHELCMISGQSAAAAEQHPKGIFPFAGNAKLISANDNSGFTYRGRFTTESQAASIGYVSSQKAHNALRWLISEQHVYFGGRTFLCWNPQGYHIVNPTGSLWGEPVVTKKPTDYKDALYKKISGYRVELPDSAGVVIAAFDAATTGRLALTYYNELVGSDFLSRLYDWDATCCWYEGPYGIQSPSLKRIVDFAYGVRRKENDRERYETDDRVMRQQLQRLLSCRIDRGRIPADVVHRLTNRASSPAGCAENLWRNVLFTACAVLNKYLTDQKGMNAMSWDLNYPDRSFQFGRLLAAMERVENEFYRGETSEDKDKNRQTSAIKAMAEFRRRPFSTYERVNRHLLQAYLPRVAPYARTQYAMLRDDIMMKISEFPPEDLNKPLDDIYLMGYDLQHADFYKSKSTEDTIDEAFTEEEGQ